MSHDDTISELKTEIKEIAKKQDSQLEKLNLVNVYLARHETAFLTHLQQDEKMYHELRGINDRLEIYNKELAIHIAGVQELRKSNDLLEKKVNILQDMWESEKKITESRIKKLEEPQVWLSISKKYILFFSLVLGAIASIAGAIQSIFKF